MKARRGHARCSVVAGVMLIATCTFTAAGDDGKRTVIPLDGTWEITEGPTDNCPGNFSRKVPVPGLVDMAKPAFAEVGVKSRLRDAFWYRRKFRIDGPVPAVAVLKVYKAMFATRVLVNGVLLGDHVPCFTPGCFDAKPALRPGDNEILIRVGATRESVPKVHPSGWDYEKALYIPGIYDSVELILCGLPHLVRVQAVPEIEKQQVAVCTWVRRATPAAAATLKLLVREAATGRIVGEATCQIPAGPDGSERVARATIPIRDCHLWSPEDPFLYDLEVRGEADAISTRFGMRSFRLDPATGRAILNGRPYFLRGSNFCIFRFMEDRQRVDRPWREEWVRRLHKKMCDMHWNCLRYCIGFPPEQWYRIADEEGLLIQDEFPIWNMPGSWTFPDQLQTEVLASEYKEWIEERWNHPCVVLWDACNETLLPQTGKAIQQVRGLDLSNRPWDNGFSAAVAPGDSRELHPYHFSNPNFELASLAQYHPLGWSPGKNPIIVNEYGWLWLNRDGSPTCITEDVYRHNLGANSTAAERRYLYARLIAAETEYWRCHRECAAVMHFCSLGYSRPRAPEAKLKPGSMFTNTAVFGLTSDEWTDVEQLTLDPAFASLVRDAFSPVGLMIDAWAAKYPAGKTVDFPVVVINDLSTPWKGAVRFRLLGEGTTLQEKAQPVTIPALGSMRLVFAMTIPSRPGKCQAEAALTNADQQPVRSLRDFRVTATQGSPR